jgi:protein-disulfide isomerase
VVIGGGTVAAISIFSALSSRTVPEADGDDNRSAEPAGPGPRNMASDGIRITRGAVATETRALDAGETPVPHTRDGAAGAIDIQIYIDYLCPFCAQFQATNGDYITSLLDNGTTTVEIHPISILDGLSQGTEYSTRAANAAACVANYSPDQFYDFHNLLFANQPEENSRGLSDDELVEFTTQAGVERGDEIASCISTEEFDDWVADASARALDGPIPDSDVDRVVGTPTVIVNGEKYTGALSDLTSFQAFVLQTAGSD